MYYSLLTSITFKIDKYNTLIQIHNYCQCWDMNNYFKNERMTYKQ